MNWEFCPGGRLLGVAEGAGPQQALPRARVGLAVLHRPAQVPHAGAAGGPLPARAHLHQQAGREAVPRAAAAQGRPALLSARRLPYQPEDPDIGLPSSGPVGYHVTFTLLESVSILAPFWLAIAVIISL